MSWLWQWNTEYKQTILELCKCFQKYCRHKMKNRHFQTRSCVLLMLPKNVWTWNIFASAHASRKWSFNSAELSRFHKTEKPVTRAMSCCDHISTMCIKTVENPCHNVSCLFTLMRNPLWTQQLWSFHFPLS